MAHGSNLIERIKTDLKAFEFGLIRFYPLNQHFPRSIMILFGSGLSGLGEKMQFLRIVNANRNL